MARIDSQLRRSSAGACLVLGAWLTVFAPSVVHAQTASAPGEAPRDRTTLPEHVQLILAQSRLDEARSVESTGAELAELGCGALPSLFASLCSAIACDAAPSSASPALSRDESAILFALDHLPPSRLHAFLDEIAQPDTTVATRMGALRIVAHLGVARDLTLSIRLADRTPTDAGLERAFESTIGALLRNDPATYGALERSFQGMAPALRAPLVRAVSSARTVEGLRLLAHLLHQDDELRPLVFVSIGRTCRDLPRPIDEDVLASVRRFVVEADPVALPEALLAVGYLDDCESIPQLIALLKSPRRGLRANALWSLQRITGLGIAETPDRWTSWYQSEREWWQSQWPSSLADLRGAHPDRVKSALVGISPHHLFRHVLACEVTRVLAHDDIEVVTLACTTLAALKSSASVSALLECLSHPDTIVRMAAWNALRSVTGKNFPPDAKVWLSAFAQS